MNDIWDKIIKLMDYHNEGILTTDHLESVYTNGKYAAAGGGNNTNAKGNFSFAFGNNVSTNIDSSAIFGQYGSLTNNDNTIGIFGIADGISISDRPIFEIQKSNKNYEVVINDFKVCQTIRNNTNSINDMLNSITNLGITTNTIERNLDELNNTFDNYIPITSIIETEDSPEINTVYSARWVYNKLNNLSSLTSTQKEILDSLSIHENKLFFKETPLATTQYVNDIIENLIETSNTFGLTNEYSATNTTNAISGFGVSQALKTIPSEYKNITIEGKNYNCITFNNSPIAIGNYPYISNDIVFAIGNGFDDGKSNITYSNLFAINKTEGAVYVNDKKLAFDKDKFNILNLEPQTIGYGSTTAWKSSIEFNDNLILKNQKTTMTLTDGLLEFENNNSQIAIKGVYVPEEHDGYYVATIGYVNNLISTLSTNINNQKMNKFGTVIESDTDDYIINNFNTLTFSGNVEITKLSLEDININNNIIIGLADLNDDSEGSVAVNKNYVDSKIFSLNNLIQQQGLNLTTLINNKQDWIANRENTSTTLSVLFDENTTVKVNRMPEDNYEVVNKIHLDLEIDAAKQYINSKINYGTTLPNVIPPEGTIFILIEAEGV